MGEGAWVLFDLLPARHNEAVHGKTEKEIYCGFDGVLDKQSAEGEDLDFKEHEVHVKADGIDEECQFQGFWIEHEEGNDDGS